MITEVTIGNTIYIKEQKLGKGAYGTVFKVKDKSSGTEFALKEIIGPTDRAIEEYEIMASMFNGETCYTKTGKNDNTFCQNIVKPHQNFQVGDHYYIVMEYVDGGDLENYLLNQKLWTKQDKLYPLMQQMVNAVFYMHDIVGIIHGDLKFENILVQKEGNSLVQLKGKSQAPPQAQAHPQSQVQPQAQAQIKISDFGISCFQVKCNHVGGTRTYMDPMLFYENAKLKNECDIYSLGVIFFEMVAGEQYNPRVYMSENEILNNFEKKKEKYLNNKSDIFNLIFNMLQPFTPQRRLNIVEIQSLFKNSYDAKYNWEAAITYIVKQRQEAIIMPQDVPSRPTRTRADYYNQYRSHIKAEHNNLYEIAGSAHTDDIISGVGHLCGEHNSNFKNIIRSVIAQMKKEGQLNGEHTGGNSKKTKTKQKKKSNLTKSLVE